MANIDRSPPALYHGTDVWRFRVSPGYPSLARGAGARHPVSPTRIDRADTPHPLARPRAHRAPLGRPRLDSLIEGARGVETSASGPRFGRAVGSTKRRAARRDPKLLAEGADFGLVFHQKTTPKPRRWYLCNTSLKTARCAG